MFGYWAFGIAPFAGDERDLEVIFAEQVVYAATHSFTTSPDDDLPDTYVPSRLKQPLVFERSIISDKGIGGAASVGYGDLVLENSDGKYDEIVGNNAIDGRRVTLRLGDPDTMSYDEFGVIFDGTAEGWGLTSDGVVVSLRDWTLELEQPLARHYYGGTGGADGTADLAGKPIPQCWGYCFNVPGTLVDPLDSLWQFNDGAMEDVISVYDAGIELDDDGSAYTVDLAAGTITMLVAVVGPITATVKGTKRAGEYLSTTADIVEAMVRDRLDWDDADFDLASFGAVNDIQPAEVGFFSNDDASVKNAIDRLLDGIGAFRNFLRDGRLSIGVFTGPTDLPDVIFTEINFIGDLDRLAPTETTNPPTWRWRVGYERNWTVQTSGLASGVPENWRSWLAQEYRYAEAHDNLVKANFLLARDAAPREAFFAIKTDADAEALRLLTLFARPRAIYQGYVKTQPYVLELNASIRIHYPRWGMAEGVATRAVTIRDDGPNDRVQLTVFA